MRVILAPMQGVLDPFVRQLLTEINNYDLCVSEFIRVVDQKLPQKVFYRHCPELMNPNCCTASGTPVRVQLLGQSPHWLAENAQLAIQLGSNGIDFNCGCPSKSVNGSGGGASLLKQPELIYQALKAIRAAVPVQQVVSAKIRLGWDNSEHKFEIADAVEQGGATEITVHGRTKIAGYDATLIDWQSIAQIRQRLTIPVIANGEVWDWESAQACRLITGCDALMVARGALNTPNLSHVIKANQTALPWRSVLNLLERYTQLENPHDHGKYHLGRIKQWFSYLKQQYPEAELLSRQIRTAQRSSQLSEMISQSIADLSVVEKSATTLFS